MNDNGSRYLFILKVKIETKQLFSANIVGKQTKASCAILRFLRIRISYQVQRMNRAESAIHSELRLSKYNLVKVFKTPIIYEKCNYFEKCYCDMDNMLLMR